MFKCIFRDEPILGIGKVVPLDKMRSVAILNGNYIGGFMLSGEAVYGERELFPLYKLPPLYSKWTHVVHVHK